MSKVLTPKINTRIISARDVADAYGLNMWLFGPPGTGKTTLAASAQDSEYGADVLFIDIEGGTRSIIDRPDIDVIRPSTFGEVREIYNWILDEDPPYKTFVIDTMNELQRLGLRDILQTSKDPEWPQLQDWGRSNEQITRMIRAYKNLATDHGKNIIFISHANEQKDEVTGGLFIRPNLTPKATEAATGIVDVVGYLNMERDGKRTLLLQPTNTIMAKYRQPRTGAQLPAKIENPTLVEILAHLRKPASASTSKGVEEVSRVAVATTT